MSQFRATGVPVRPRPGVHAVPTGAHHVLKDGRVVLTEAPTVGRYNVYDCLGDDRHALLSIEVDEGVTPMFVTCPDDGATAASRCYSRLTPYPFPVRMIWRKATNGEMKRERRDQGSRGHYASGGLAREWVESSSVVTVNDDGTADVAEAS